MRSPWRAPAAWGLAGFVCGIAFWHLVGFWGFVSRIVFKGTAPAAIAAPAAKPPDALDGTARSLSAAPAARCVELQVSRDGAPVAALPCAGAAPLIKAGPLASRGDQALQRLHLLAPSVAGWSTQVESTPGSGAAAQ